MNRPAKEITIVAVLVVICIVFGAVLENGQSPTLKWETYWLGRLAKQLPKRRPNTIDEASQIISNAGADSNAKADAFATRANVYLRMGQWGTAERDVRAGLLSKPHSHQTLAWLWLLQGMIDDEKNEHSAAVSDFTKALAADPGQSGFQLSGLFCRAVAERKAGDQQKSFADLDRALVQLTVLHRQEITLLSGLDELGRKHIAITIERTSDQMKASLLKARAEASRAVGNYGSAILNYSAAIVLLPQDPTLYAGRGQALFLNGRWSSGVRDLSRAAELSYSTAPRWSRSAECGG